MLFSLRVVRQLRLLGLLMGAIAGLVVNAHGGDSSPSARASDGAAAKSSQTKDGLTEAAVDPLLEKIERAIYETGRRRLTAGVHTPWQVVHGILAMRWDMRLLSKEGRSDLNAIEWVANNPSFEGEPMWLVTPFGGRGHPYTRPYAFEGHPTQFLGYMTMADIPLDYEFQADKGVVTIRDIVRDAKMNVKAKGEITWTLWALAHYEHPDSHWINAQGEPWSVERLVKIQVDEPVTRGPCGGTHGLFVLAYARNQYLHTGRPLRGAFIEADQKVNRYIAEAKSLQNPDGSLSSKYYTGPGHTSDLSDRIRSSGHQMEWLMIAMPQSRLKEEWIRKALERTADDLLDARKTPTDCGPLYHAMHSLVCYRQRVRPELAFPQHDSPLKLTERGRKPVTTVNSPAKVEKKDPVEKLASRPNDTGTSKSAEPNLDKKPTEAKGSDSKPESRTPITAPKPPASTLTSSKGATPGATTSTTESGPVLTGPSLTPPAKVSSNVTEAKPASVAPAIDAKRIAGPALETPRGAPKAEREEASPALKLDSPRLLGEGKPKVRREDLDIDDLDPESRRPTLTGANLPTVPSGPAKRRPSVKGDPSSSRVSDIAPPLPRLEIGDKPRMTTTTIK